MIPTVSKYIPPDQLSSTKYSFFHILFNININYTTTQKKKLKFQQTMAFLDFKRRKTFFLK